MMNSWFFAQPAWREMRNQQSNAYPTDVDFTRRLAKHDQIGPSRQAVSELI
jgi:hypothetical protein